MSKTISKTAALLAITSSLLSTACLSTEQANARRNSMNIPENTFRGQVKSQARPDISIAKLVPFDTADGVDLELKNQCAIDICGPVLSVTSAPSAEWRAKIVEARNFEVQANQKLAALIDTAVNRDADALRITIRKILSQKDALLTHALSPTKKAIVNSIWALSTLRKTDDIFENGVISKAKLKSHLSLNDVDADHLKLMAEKYVASTAIAQSQLLDKIGADGFFRMLARSNDAEARRQAAKTWALAVKTKVEFLITEMPAQFESVSPAILALADGKDIDSVQATTLSGDIGGTFYADVMTTDLEAFTRRDVNFNELVKTFTQTTALEMLQKKSNTARMANVQKAVVGCGPVVANISRLKVIESDAMAGIAPLIAKVKAHGIEVSDRFNADLSQRQLVRAALSEVRFSYPASAEERLAKIENALKEDIQQSENTIARIDQGTLDAHAPLIAGAIYMGDLDSDLTEEICEPQDPDQIGDFTNTAMGYIEVSWPTIISPATGTGILAHEFGHAASTVFDRLKTTALPHAAHASTKQCLSERQHKIAGVDYTEEDFADLYSTKIIESLRSEQIHAGNFGCALLGRNETRWGVRAGLTMKYPSMVGDDHSPHLNRVMAIEINAGRTLPSSCQQVVDQGLPSLKRVCL